MGFVKVFGQSVVQKGFRWIWILLELIQSSTEHHPTPLSDVEEKIMDLEMWGLSKYSDSLLFKRALDGFGFYLN